tara:strand:- start:1180 stop:2526 length:1347 start_codon:yes stop_codon:yes gene_type:complete
MHIHILGICGTFMAGIAALAKSQGHKVSGCDQNVYPPMSTQLEDLGISITEGFSEEQIILNPDVFVIGNVISRGNPLMESILDKRLPYISGPQWLYDNILFDKWVIAVAGTHGKTTTTAMLAWILEFCGFAPGFLIGGIPNNFDVSARLPVDSKINTPSFFVIEADEYDTAFFDKRSKFIHYHPKTLVLNNLEFDHADIFKDLTHIETHFHHLVRTIPSQGRIIINHESPSLKTVIERGCWTEVEYIGANTEWETKDHEIFHDEVKQIPLQWDLIGRHNYMNALAAIAAAKHVGITPENSIKALSQFKSVKKRMEKIYTIDKIELYDDFAHHPSAIQTTLEGLQKSIKNGRIIAIIEPRSNTMKLGNMKIQLIKSLKAADAIFCYAHNLSWDAHKLFKNVSNTEVHENVSHLAEKIAQFVQSEDKIIFMSNGSFSGLQSKVAKLLNHE